MEKKTNVQYSPTMTRPVPLDLKKSNAAGQTTRMRGLPCTFVVRVHQNPIFS